MATLKIPCYQQPNTIPTSLGLVGRACLEPLLCQRGQGDREGTVPYLSCLYARSGPAKAGGYPIKLDWRELVKRRKERSHDLAPVHAWPYSTRATAAVQQQQYGSYLTIIPDIRSKSKSLSSVACSVRAILVVKRSSLGVLDDILDILCHVSCSLRVRIHNLELEHGPVPGMGRIQDQGLEEALGRGAGSKLWRRRSTG